MFVLIIEDDSQKAQNVWDLVAEVRKGVQMHVCRSYQSGLRWLSEPAHCVDLVILDMSLPTFDPTPDQRQGRPRPLGGHDLMRKLRRAGRSPAVVVLTALENFGLKSEQLTFEELSKRCAAEFPEMFRSAIQYSQSSSGWRSKLTETIREISC
jgi:CheY-like chemotaxis protein